MSEHPRPDAPARLAGVIADLVAEQDALDAIVGERGEDDWQRPTPSPGWSIADQIGHLAYFDAAAVAAIEDPAGFAALAASLNASPERIDELTLRRSLAVADLLTGWRGGRGDLRRALSGLRPGGRVAWFGPPMGAQSFVTGRLMEVWAHGQDIADALEITRTPTDRLRHVAHLGYTTRAWSYVNRGLPVPAEDIAVTLSAPSGGIWRWGPDGIPPAVTGPALDFCLVVTKRRHLADTALVIGSEAARDWMLRAQAFAGAPTDGPPPRHGNHHHIHPSQTPVIADASGQPETTR